MGIRRLLPALLSSLLVLAAANSPAASPGEPILYLVAIGDAANTVTALQQYYRETLRLHVETLPPFTPPLSAWNSTGRQWVAEDLVNSLIERDEARLRAENAGIVAITPDDLVSAKEGVVYGLHTAARVGVVSFARLDTSRLRKMVTRYVGLTALQMPSSPDRRSPLYGGIRSAGDLDAMGDDLMAAGMLVRRPLNDYRGPVTLVNGAYSRRDYELRLDDEPSVSFERTYRSNDTEPRGLPFGIGSNHSYGSFLVGDSKSFSWVDLILDNGARVHYRRVSPGTGYRDAVFVHDDSPSVYANSRLSWRDGGWLIELPDGRSYRHPDCSPAATRPCTLSGYRDRNGREVRMTFDEAHNLTRLETPNHKFIELAYDTSNRIVRARDGAEHSWAYEYDHDGRLVRATASAARTVDYTYDSRNHMTSAQTPTATETMTYDAGGRCVDYESRRTVYVDAAGHAFEQRVHDTFSYELNAPSDNYVRSVTVTDGSGVRRITYDSAGYELSNEFGVGTPLEQHTTYVRDAQTRQASHITVSCGVGDHAKTITDSVTLGQSATAIVDRARLECDRQMLSASR